MLKQMLSKANHKKLNDEYQELFIASFLRAPAYLGEAGKRNIHSQLK